MNDRRMMLHRVTKDSVNKNPFISIKDIPSSFASYQDGRNLFSVRLNLEDAKSMADAIYELLSKNDKAEQRTEIRWCHNIGDSRHQTQTGGRG